MIALAGWKTGDWDTTIAQVEAGLAGATDARTRAIAIDNLATIKAFRGENIDDHVAELEATATLDGTDAMRRIAWMSGPSSISPPAGSRRRGSSGEGSWTRTSTFASSFCGPAGSPRPLGERD